MEFKPDTIGADIADLADCTGIVVALSGGMDSMVLLHSLKYLVDQHLLSAPLRAIHVNHGISPDAATWQQLCSDTCGKLDVPLQVESVDLDIESPANLEERARDARYAVFANVLGAEEVLVMGHHLDDQMETILLRLMRGAGISGLSGIPRSRRLGAGILLRPLLSVSRDALLGYAQSSGIQWVSDEGNESLAFDRNFCRHQLLPLVESRWPGYRASWEKSRQLIADSAQLLTGIAHQDLLRVATQEPAVILLEPLKDMDEARQRNVLRYWLINLGFPEPGWTTLHRLTRDILHLQPGAAGYIDYKSGRLQCYQDKLYALNPLQYVPDDSIDWSFGDKEKLLLPENGYLMSLTSGQNPVQSAQAPLLCMALEKVSVHYREGGEKVRLAGRPEKTVKQLLQEARVLPWQRDCYPLLCNDNAIVLIPGLGVAADFIAAPGETGRQITWSAPCRLFGH